MSSFGTGLEKSAVEKFLLAVIAVQAEIACDDAGFFLPFDMPIAKEQIAAFKMHRIIGGVAPVLVLPGLMIVGPCRHVARGAKQFAHYDNIGGLRNLRTVQERIEIISSRIAKDDAITEVTGIACRGRRGMKRGIRAGGRAFKYLPTLDVRLN